MQNLIESIRAQGVLTPCMVRKKKDGRYELISGHRRKRACELLGMDALRCEIVELSKEQARQSFLARKLLRIKCGWKL